MSATIITLDVRDDIRSGREPFSKIMATVATLQGGTNLLVIAPFEPVPLFHVLGKQGFCHYSRQTAAGYWEVLFSRGEENPTARPAAQVVIGQRDCVATQSAEPVDLDARNLEPPQPMVAILEALASLPPDAILRARTDRRPMHLYAQLEARGFAGESTEQTDGSFITQIRRC